MSAKMAEQADVDTSMPSFGMSGMSGLDSEEINKLIDQGGFLLQDSATMDPNGFNLQQPGQPSSMQVAPNPNLNTANQPHVEIVEEPKQRGLRFRYKCEGRSAGSIPGANSSNEQRTYPTIKIHNYNGQSAIVVVSCVTSDEVPRPHPHSLVGKDCNKGVCTVKLKNSSHTVSFPNLGVQCATRKAVKQALEDREKIRVDPFGTGYYKDINKIDLNIVRLCFQVFLPDENSKFTRIVNPVISQPIYDKKAVNDLIICRLSRQSGCAHGGDEVFILCEKVNKDDIQVRFFEETDEGTVWEAYGEFAPNDVHRQFAIVCKTPPYKDQYITGPVTVSVQLVRPSDDGQSDAKPFQYIPDDPDPDGILSKRKRKAISIDFLSDNYGILPPVKAETSEPQPANVSVKERLKAKATRNKPKREPNPSAAAPPQYSFNNITSPQGGMGNAHYPAASQGLQQVTIPQQNQPQMHPGIPSSQGQPTQMTFPPQAHGVGIQPQLDQPGPDGMPQRIDYVNTQEDIENTNSDQILQFLTDHMAPGPEAVQGQSLAELTTYLQGPDGSGAT